MPLAAHLCHRHYQVLIRSPFKHDIRAARVRIGGIGGRIDMPGCNDYKVGAVDQPFLPGRRLGERGIAVVGGAATLEHITNPNRGKFWFASSPEGSEPLHPLFIQAHGIVSRGGGIIGETGPAVVTSAQFDKSAPGLLGQFMMAAFSEICIRPPYRSSNSIGR